MADEKRASEYRELGVNAWNLLRNWCLEDTEWKESFTKDDVVVSRKDLAATDWHAKGKLFKAVGVIQDCCIDDLIALVTDMPNRPLWDVHNDLYEVLCVIEDGIDVLHTGVKGMFAVSARDFTSVRKTVYDVESGLWISAQVNCEHDTPKEFKKKYIRGSVLPSGWTFEKVDDNTTKVYYVAGVHLAGWLPQSAVDHAIEQNTFKFFPLVRDIFANKERYELFNKQK